MVKTNEGLRIRSEDVVEREYAIPHNAKLLVENGQLVRAGDPITDGPINPQEYLETRGRDAVQRYLVKEVQRVYRSQGVTINDKHIEIIVRQMLRKVRIDQPGDSEQLPFELVDKFDFEEINNQVMAEGGEPATAETVLLGVTKASLNTSSFLAAASFQETTRVLTEAAITGSKDRLLGLKENVIIGKLIPAGSGAPQNLAAARAAARRAAAEALAGGELPEGFGDEEINIFLAEAQARAEAEAEAAARQDFNPLLGDAPGEGPLDGTNPFLMEDDEEDDEEDEPPSLEEEAEAPAANRDQGQGTCQDKGGRQDQGVDCSDNLAYQRTRRTITRRVFVCPPVRRGGSCPCDRGQALGRAALRAHGALAWRSGRRSPASLAARQTSLVLRVS